MIMKFYFIYILFFCIYQLSIYSYGVNDDDDIDRRILSESFIRVPRIKRASNSSISLNISIVSPSYIITNFNATVPVLSTPGNVVSTPTNFHGFNSTTVINLSTTSPYNPDSCFNTTVIKLSNGTCMLKSYAQMFAVSILRNNSMNGTDKMNALSLYISSITNSKEPKNQTNTLSINEIDDIVDNLGGINLTINSNTSFVSVQQPDQGNDIIVLGASYKRGIGGSIVDTINRENITKSSISAAAIINKESLNGVISLNMVIIDKPSMYENADISTNKTIASSVVVATIRKNDTLFRSINITLYFKVLEEYTPNISAKYSCAFFDTNNSQWNESGCTDARYSSYYGRYECSCNHLTSFALIWLPQSLTTFNQTKALNAQDISSIIFMSISILCFMAIIIHAISFRILNPSMTIQTLNLLPLISTASTTILFILFIALAGTVNIQTSSSDESECFLSSTVLMFFVYFFLIFMFCVKTSVGYFYYLRFVHLFPQPSHRKLVLMLFISFLISILCVSLAIGFNSNSSFNITQLYPYEFCWFTRDVIYYFMTIPVGIFLLLNIITITLVSKSIINHARNASTSKQINGRLKRCVIILLSSCVTQGIGWLFGPFISFINLIAGEILGWIFIILNGLEGLWSILLYILIRSQQLDDQKHIAAVIDLSKSSGGSLNKERKLSDKNNLRSYPLNDLRRREPTNLSSDEEDKTNKIS